MQKTKLKTILKEISLFKGLDDSKLEELVSISKVKEYRKDNTIFYEGEESHSLIVLAEGTVRICKHNSKGDKINIGIFKPYSLVAEAATLKHTSFPATAYCEDDVKIVYIELETFSEKFIADPSVSYMIIDSLLEKIRMIETNIEINIASNAKDKILSYYERSQTLNLGLKNYEIASLLGMSPETFSRNLKKLEKDALILKSDTGYKVR